MENRTTPPSKHVYIHTIGCQMNVYDSGHMQRLLYPLGYEPSTSPETADIIILNTCTIREKAEQKALSFLGRLAPLKRKRPDLIIGVGGCVAQQEGKKILRRMPHLDFVIGTRATLRLPDIVRRITAGERRIVDIDLADGIFEGVPYDYRPDNASPLPFVTIMRGCDNYCTYCVVPYVRGRETSRSAEDILKEIRNLVDSGVREVTLLGQNVNSYGKREGLCSFSQLLARVNDIDGLLRIRFTTSHPKDFSDEVISAFQTVEKLCPHLHLPVQSGSNRVLKAMNRKYTRERYLEKIEQLRTRCPGVAISSDILVGFPGETTEDFDETMTLIKSVEYDSLFVFKYSDRPNAPSAHFTAKISDADKQFRLERVLNLQEQITRRKNAVLMGSTQTILVDGRGKAPPEANCVQWSGRTPTNKIVNFEPRDLESIDKADLIGRLVAVKIERVLSHSLWGRPIGVVDSY